MLLIVKTLLCTRDGSRRNHIDEAIGMVVNKTDALLAGLRGDEHDDAQVVLVCNGFHDVQIVIEGQVGNDGTTDAGLDTTLAKSLNTIVKDGIEITH